MGEYIRNEYEEQEDNKKKCQDNIAKPVEPVFEKSIPIVFATDEKFVPYLYVAIQSFVDNSTFENNYDIVILYENVCDYKQLQLKNFEAKNISIRFVNMAELMNKYKDSWFVHWHYSSAVYYRFFITQLFEKYSKVLYLDGDIAINCDVAELYNMDLEDNYIGAVQEFSMQHKESPAYKYIPQKLGLKNEDYFNAGILVFNLEELRKINFLEACIETLEKLKKPIFQDQDVLNKLCSGRIKYLDLKYNFAWNTINYYKSIEKYISAESLAKLEEAKVEPKILHYCGIRKPWKEPWLPYSEYFWKYARKTPFYEELLFEHAGRLAARDVVKNVLERKKVYLEYLGCKIFRNFAKGERKEQIKNQASKLKKRITDYRETLKG